MILFIIQILSKKQVETVRHDYETRGYPETVQMIGAIWAEVKGEINGKLRTYVVYENMVSDRKE